MAGMDELEKALESLKDPETQRALSKLLELARNMERAGILDLLLALTDEEVFKRIVALVMTTGTMKLADRLPELLDKLGAAAEALTGPSKPMGVSELLSSLGDPRVARGLYRVVEALKAIGSEP